MKSTRLSFDILETNDCKTLGLYSFESKFKTDPLLKLGGIYIIKCKSTGKFYLGSSKNFSNRFQWHRENLKRGTHYNTKLQYAFNKYGKDNFVFEIIRFSPIIERSFLISQEQKHLNEYFPDSYTFRLKSLNLKKVADGGIAGVERKHLRKKIYVFDLNMNFIECVLGVNETSKKYNNAHVAECCKGKIYSSMGYIFRYSDNIFIRKKDLGGGKKGDTHKDAKKVYQYDTNGNFIQEWRCIADAAKSLNISESFARKVANKKYKSAKGFIFEYEKLKEC